MPGPWDSEESGFGPVISSQAKERIIGLIEKGKLKLTALLMAVNAQSKDIQKVTGLVRPYLVK